jgi:hypothetical protein
MPLVALLVGALIIVAALRNVHGGLASALEEDVPGYFTWAIALAAVGALGYVPGLKTPSRMMLALIFVVLVVVNYRQMLAGFTGFAASGATPSPNQAAAEPAAAYATGNTNAVPSPQQIAGSITPGSNASGPVTQVASAAGLPNPYDPATYLHGFPSSFGFGGHA